MSNNQVYIKIESATEQQENMKNSRKTLKILQRGAIDKENLAGRPTVIGKTGFIKSKSDVEFKLGVGDLLKRKKVDTKTAQTQTEASLTQSTDTKTAKITAEDLTTDETPGEHYWEILAEKRRLALDETLEENKNLHERIYGLESELETSQQMLDEAKNLVEILTEMLEENEAKATQTNNETEINQGASTSTTDASKYFDADSSESPTKIKKNLQNDSDDDD